MSWKRRDVKRYRSSRNVLLCMVIININMESSATTNVQGTGPVQYFIRHELERILQGSGSFSSITLNCSSFWRVLSAIDLLTHFVGGSEFGIFSSLPCQVVGFGVLHERQARRVATGVYYILLTTTASEGYEMFFHYILRYL